MGKFSNLPRINYISKTIYYPNVLGQNVSYAFSSRTEEDGIYEKITSLSILPFRDPLFSCERTIILAITQGKVETRILSKNVIELLITFEKSQKCMAVSFYGYQISPQLFRIDGLKDIMFFSEPSCIIGPFEPNPSAPVWKSNNLKMMESMNKYAEKMKSNKIEIVSGFRI